MDYYSEDYFTNYTSKKQQLVVCEIIITTLVNKEPFEFKRKFFFLFILFCPVAGDFTFNHVNHIFCDVGYMVCDSLQMAGC